MKKGFRLISMVLSCWLALGTNSSLACTAFMLKLDDDFVVAKNYDWFRNYPHGALFTNARNLKKTALKMSSEERPAQWVSKYGSITFTQFGRELPISGINEKGLVVEMLQLTSSKYNSTEKNKPFVNEAQFSQYILDNYATLEEVIMGARTLRVEKAFVGIHYFVCDAKANCATFEFLDGKLHEYTSRTLPIPVLTNHPYEVLLRDYQNTEDQDSHNRLATRSSKYRFWKAAQMMRDSQEAIAELPDVGFSKAQYMESYAFQILDAVQMKFGPALDGITMVTQWRIVYHPASRSVSFETRENMKIKSLKLSDFDFSCNAKGRMLDMSADFLGSVNSRMVDFTPALNAKLVEKNEKLISSEKVAAAKTAATSVECITPLTQP